MPNSNINEDSYLTREAVSAALTETGFPVAARTLAAKATRGGGPPYRMFGGRALYRWGDALAWARQRISAPRGVAPSNGPGSARS